ncbi:MULTISPECIES: hypothetical protein [Paenibacillus]|uniref:Uncharacterized protein n=1 Tax=Paenibacillus albilobatus TaxID=2716884 RepID=A0A920CAU5_9BACL|nr:MULTISPECIES: hypothetical protein [Paenibacillus]GIO31288.1 hypothetical protein J2TS6_24290 [Paenibacillus albilobatus]
MIVIQLLGITLLAAAIFAYDYPRLRTGAKKEKIAFAVITAAGWAIALLLMFFPRMPGPTELINYATRPIWNIFYPEG